MTQENPPILFAPEVEARLQAMRDEVNRLTDENRRDPLKFSELQAAKDRLTAYSIQQKRALQQAARRWLDEQKRLSRELQQARESSGIKCGWPRSMDPVTLDEPLRSAVLRMLGLPLSD